MERSYTLPDRGAAAQLSDSDAVRRFAAIVIADPVLTARLGPIEDAGAFLAQSISAARTHNLALTEASLLTAIQPDPLGLARWSNRTLAGPAAPPHEWLPIAVTADAGLRVVDWAWFGPEPLRGSFYEDDIRRVLGLPFNRAFRYRTGFRDLIAQAEEMESLAPNGFIFHMSRCGSTLVAQMLAALDDTIVISEAAPFDAVVQLCREQAEEDAVQALRSIVAAFGRKRSGRERRYVIKLDCWHTLALPLFRRAFPDVPWIFLYRDPVEVLVSQMRQRGMQMVPQFLPPSIYGIAPDDVTLDEDYCARVLAAVCQAVIDHHGMNGRDLSGGLILNYRQLPEAVYSTILPHFGISCGQAERDKMRLATQQNVKSPSLRFVGDIDEKQRAATPNLRRTAEQHLGAVHRRLEAMMKTASSTQIAVS
jgi:hypothetical protein